MLFLNGGSAWRLLLLSVFDADTCLYQRIFTLWYYYFDSEIKSSEWFFSDYWSLITDHCECVSCQIWSWPSTRWSPSFIKLQTTGRPWTPPSSRPWLPISCLNLPRYSYDITANAPITAHFTFHWRWFPDELRTTVENFLSVWWRSESGGWVCVVLIWINEFNSTKICRCHMNSLNFFLCFVQSVKQRMKFSFLCLHISRLSVSVALY